jgi:hypothetical protein
VLLIPIVPGGIIYMVLIIIRRGEERMLPIPINPFQEKGLGRGKSC